MLLNETNNQATDDVFADVLLDSSVDNNTFPSNESNPEAAYQLVSDELILDGNSRQNLATFCQTWVDGNMALLIKSGKGRSYPTELAS
ncbi:hypothetical protein BCU00_003785 [Vibrio breoganii]|uniref:hypothetical protein n=1 Tax=Vibrio breoganii TaxID=553239 RepID=UPI0039A70B01